MSEAVLVHVIPVNPTFRTGGRQREWRKDEAEESSFHPISAYFSLPTARSRARAGRVAILAQ
jgi:hypothetical protein